MPKGERSGGGYGRDGGSGDRDSGRDKGDTKGGTRGTKSRGGYAGGTAKSGARSGGFEGGGGRDDRGPQFDPDAMLEHPFGPLGYGVQSMFQHLATPNPDGSYGYTNPEGFTRPDGGDRTNMASNRSFEDWMGQGGFAGPELGSPGADFYDQARFGGGMGGPSADKAATAMPTRGDNVMSLLDRAGGNTQSAAVVPGTSPQSAQLYGYGSPYLGPQDVFGGM